MELGPLLIPLIIAVVVALVIAGGIHARKVRQEFLAWAASRGFAVDESHDDSMETRFPELDCLRRGDDRYAYDIISGDWKGRPLLGFHYHYETHSRDSKGHQQTHHHNFSVVTLRSDIPLKDLLVRPENVLDKVAGFFGAEDINFESAEFSRAFYVKSADRKWAYDVIHARMIEFFLGAPRFCIEMHGDCVFAWRDSRFRIRDFEDAAYFLDGILDRLPEYLKRQQLEETT